MAAEKDKVEEKLVEIKRDLLDMKARSGGKIKEEGFEHISMKVFKHIEFLLKLIEKNRKREIEVPFEEVTDDKLLELVA